MQEFIALAKSLADKAGDITKKYYRTQYNIDSKEDSSPVTIADREIEAHLREIIETARPEDGIIGEEFGNKDPKNEYKWVIDPIDGTKSFVIGRPTFGTLIALCQNDTPILGIIDQPITQERWLGIDTQEQKFCTYNDKAVKTRSCRFLEEACCASTTPAMFEGIGPIYEVFEKKCKMMAWGGDCYMYGLLANGYMDLAVEANLSAYDFAALVPVIHGAGGIMCDWNGDPLNLQSDGRVLAVGDLSLQEAALRCLSS